MCLRMSNWSKYRNFLAFPFCFLDYFFSPVQTLPSVLIFNIFKIKCTIMYYYDNYEQLISNSWILMQLRVLRKQTGEIHKIHLLILSEGLQNIRMKWNGENIWKEGCTGLHFESSYNLLTHFPLDAFHVT